MDILENDLGCKYIHGEKIAPNGEASLRIKWDDVILEPILKEVIGNLNPDLPEKAIEETIKN